VASSRCACGVQGVRYGRCLNQGGSGAVSLLILLRQRRGEPHDKADALSSGGDRGCCGGGKRGGFICGLEEAEATFPGENGRIAYASWDGRDSEIYTIKVGGGGKTNVTNNNTNDAYPDYSPDGKRIAYTVYNDSQGDIYTINAFGGGKTQVTTTANADEHAPSWGSRP
jgi:hypothetical protein